MQTKKRISGRNDSREHDKVSRSQKTVSENVQTGEKKVAELITSSARKPRHGTLLLSGESPSWLASTLAKRNGDSVVEADMNTRYNQEHDLMSNNCDPMHVKECDEGTAPCLPDTIFSPTFHISKAAGEEISSGVSFIKLFQTAEQSGAVYSKNLDESNCGDQMLCVGTNAVESRCNADSEGASLSSEVSAIYLAMKNSKLECVDEHGQDSISTDVCLDEDNYEEFDDFDPYLFIKNLPALSSVVPTFRRMLLPKQTRSCPPTTLVLDLDETLVHSTLEPCDDADFTFPVNFNLQEHTVYVRCRPYLKDFLERVAGLFEIIIFTASQSIYAEQLLNVLDPKRKLFRHRVYRESCVFVEGNYLKDLSVLGRDLARVIIIDNSPQAFGFQVDNGIPIESWFDDRSDQELLLLLRFLESLVGVEDVRPLIAKKFNLREKIAAAVYPPSISSRGDPFER